MVFLPYLEVPFWMQAGFPQLGVVFGFLHITAKYTINPSWPVNRVAKFYNMLKLL